MEYLCILNAFEQNYYNRMKEIERVAAAAAAAHGSLRNSTSSHSATSATSSTTSSAASSQSSSPTSATSSTSSAAAAKLTQQQHFSAFNAHPSTAAAAAAAFAAQPHLQHFPQQQQLTAHQQHQLQQNNSNVANSLLWQPWRDLQHAAAVHHHMLQQQQQQQLQKEARLTSKELPTTKWRRDRRLRAGEYHTPTLGAAISATSSITSPPGSPNTQTLSQSPHHHHASLALATTMGVGAAVAPPPPHTSSQISMMMAAAMRPLCESTNRPTPPSSSSSASLNAAASSLHLSHHNHHTQHNLESPIDMSVSSTSMKHRSSPPPPYREPLPGSNFATTLARPSVITQAPPKRGDSRDSILISNRENDNRSEDSISMCETVIDEHFRRSLGPDYVALFGKKSPAPANSTPSPQPLPMIGTGTPTPPLQQLQYHHQPSPPYHALPHPQALISPKPTAVLLSPAAAMAAAVAAAQVKAEPISSPTMIATPMSMVLPPPQQQPLSLQRCSSPAAAQITTANSPQSLPLPLSIAATTHMQRGTPPPPHPARPHTLELHAAPSASSPSPASPRQQQSPPAAGTPPFSNTATISSGNHTSTVLPPAIVRIKTEPGLSTAATNTPPASPTSSSNASLSANSDVLASVDDHFAKALGETWKKLQENKEMRK